MKKKIKKIAENPHVCVLVMMCVCWLILMPPLHPPPLAAGYLSECVTSAGRQAGLRGDGPVTAAVAAAAWLGCVHARVCVPVLADD